MKRATVKTAVVGLVAAVGLAGCSSSQKPATLGTSGGTAVAGAAGGTSGAPGATTTAATPSGAATTATTSANPLGTPGAVVTSALPGGGGTFLITVPSDPNGVAAVLAYQQFVSMTSQMAQTATYDKNLANVADLGALSTTETSITQMRNQNVHVQGVMTAKATVGAVNMGAQPLPMVSISACVDQSKWAFYFTSGAKKGQKAPYPAVAPYVVQVKVHKSTDGKWRVTDVTTKADQKCS